MLTASVVIGAATGVLFVFIAVHRFDTDDVGQASALFTSVLFVNYATSMGLPIVAARYAADDSDAVATLFSWALLYSAITAAVGSIVYLAVVQPAAASALWDLGVVPGGSIFIVLTVGASLAVLNDVRFMAARVGIGARPGRHRRAHPAAIRVLPRR